MTDHNTYRLEVTTKVDIPDDVIVEHVAYALRAISDPARRKARAKDVKVTLTEVVRPRKHPFEGGRVVFDDEVTPETITYAYPTDNWGTNTYTTEVFSGKAEEEPDQTVQLRGTVETPEPYEVEIDLDEVISEVYKAISEDFPYLSELFRDKRAEAEGRDVLRRIGLENPPAEGDWELPTEDNVGGDVE
jgi:hypothetical protein